MTLISILICLGIERILGYGAGLRRYDLFDQYSGKVQQLTAKTNVNCSWFRMAALLLPVVLLVALLQAWLSGTLFGLLGLVFSVFVLLLCLGNSDFNQQVRDYFDACNRDDTEAAQQAAKGLLGDEMPEQASEVSYAISKYIFIQANKQLFAVLFWFVVLGPVGAVLYRMASLMVERCDDIAKAPLLLAILDWLPVRLVGLTYALAGGFVTGFTHWLSHLGDGVHNNETILVESGFAALDLDRGDFEELEIANNQAAVALVGRALLLMLVFIALFTITAVVS